MFAQKMQTRALSSQIRNGAVIATNLTVSRLCFIASPRFASRPSTRRSVLLACRGPLGRAFCTSTSMESNLRNATRVVEHIVLLKVKEGVPTEQQDAMVSGLRSLKRLPMVIELNAGKVVNASSEAYTHALHCRYTSKEDLSSYANDPYHLDVINKHIVPIVEDRLALDWEADVEEPILQSGSYGAVRMLTMKPKEDLENSDLSSIVDTLREHKTRFPFIKQVSVGKNFSPARAKGYEWAYLVLFPSPLELAELTKSVDYGNLHSKVSSTMEKINVVDYHTN